MVKFIGFLLFVSLTSSSLLAHIQFQVTEDDRIGMMASFAVSAAVAYGLQKGSSKFGLQTPVLGVLHTANALWQLGSISKNPVFNDLAVRSAVAAGSTALANLPQITQLVPMVPFIGEGLKNGGQLTHGILTVAAYKTTESLMTRLCNSYPRWNLPFCN